MSKWSETETAEKIGFAFVITLAGVFLVIAWPVTVTILFWYGVYWCFKNYKSKSKKEEPYVPPSMKERVDAENERYKVKVKAIEDLEIDQEVRDAALQDLKNKHTQNIAEIIE